MLMSNHDIYSNIITQHVPKNNVISRDMIVKKEFVRTKNTGEDVFKYSLNKEFWQNIHEEGNRISVILDEVHTLLNPRKSMSKLNVIMTDFLALVRRVVGSSDFHYGELVLITQLERRIDVIAREMATKVQYCISHYIKTCKKCGVKWQENNETANKLDECPVCSSYKIHKSNPVIQVFCFSSMKKYEMFRDFKMDSFYDAYCITDIEKVFNKYNTLQWENLITDD